MKEFNRPLLAAYLLIVALSVAGFIRVERLATTAANQACEAFHESQTMLKDILILAIPFDQELTEENTEEYERTLAFRDRLINEIEERDC